ncbi:MAG TPA: ATP synthase F0 subunit B, partial [Roseibacillus sp.]|nr:ATP synthase F0 subunit B [Roseibacillus sp.]
MPIDSILILAAAAEADSGGGNVATEIFDTFDVHWNTFICQLVNFLVVCFVLKKFAYGPVMDMLEQRRKRIADGEEKLKQVEAQIAESEKNTQAAIQ